MLSGDDRRSKVPRSIPAEALYCQILRLLFVFAQVTEFVWLAELWRWHPILEGQFRSAEFVTQPGRLETAPTRRLKVEKEKAQ